MNTTADMTVTTWCLAADIDGTMIGKTESTVALRNALLEARKRLEQQGERLYWVVATGRSLASAQEVLVEQGCQVSDFDAWIVSVGAEIYLKGESTADSTYRDRLAATGFARTDVERAVAGLPFLQPQPEQEQFPFKVSYFFAGRQEERAQLKRALGQLPFSTKLVFSHDRYLDIAPRTGTKGGAVAHLIESWGLSPDRVVAAGDSGNDAQMLTREWHGIVVGNGQADLDELRGSRRLYFALERYAAGVLEGLRAGGWFAAR